MQRGYQYGFSANSVAMFDVRGRERKAATMVRVLSNHLHVPLRNLSLLNVGGSAGIIDNYLAAHFRKVVGIDIDAPAIEHARQLFARDNLEFQVGDALALAFADNSFDVVICSQVYEHVTDPQKMMTEIYRVLCPGGVCYFAASNRLMWNEPHYDLPLLSVIPRPLAHLYVRLSGKADRYHELHYSYWGLKKLVKQFGVEDITLQMVDDPGKYGIDYLLPAGSMKARVSKLILRFVPWLSPGYIWLLKKPD